jgi:hypothetical protein
MTTDDGKTDTFDGDSASSEDAGSGVSIEPVQDARVETVIVEASISNRIYWAKLEVEYWWASDGRRFTAKTKRYQTYPNNRSRGDVYFHVGSATDSGWQTLTTNANQDGNWHTLVSSNYEVEGNADNAVIDFHYDYDVQGDGDPRLKGSETIRITVPRPAISSPVSGDSVSPLFTISGTGLTDATVEVFRSRSGNQIAPTVQVRNSQWSTTVDSAILQGYLSFTYRQKIYGKYSDWAPDVNVIVVLAPPVITSPTHNSTVNELRPNFSGTGDNGAQVRILRLNGELLGSVDVEDNQWSTALDLNWGQNTLYARQKMGNVLSLASSVTVTVIPRTLSITAPGASSYQNGQFTVSGTNGVNGATVRIYLESDNSLVGTGQPNTAANWNVTVTVPPGPVSLVARQTISGAVSVYSAARGFRIRPPKLNAPTVTYPNENQVRAIFSGGGHPGATVDVVILTGPTGALAPSPATVSGTGNWETNPTDFPPGSYTLRTTQKVGDGASGWIASDPLEHAFVRRPPQPTGISHTMDYQPTFSGTGYTNATVRLANPGGSTDAAPTASVIAEEWSSRASQVWGPTLNREVHIRQSLNDVNSQDWVRYPVTIPPLAPTLEDPGESESQPVFRGTCWPGASVTLTFSDAPDTEHAVPDGNSDGNWTFQRETPFPVDEAVTVKATQTAAEQISPQVSRTFTVLTFIPKPNISEPDAGAEVGHEPTISGSGGLKGASMQLRDAQYQRPLGSPKQLDADGEWSLDLAGLEFRRYSIDARQTFNERDSERSDVRSFEVVLLPPVFEVPQPGGNLPRTSRLSGKGRPGGRVQVWLQSELLVEDIGVDNTGHWEAEVTLPVGETTIWARQSFENQTSRDSPSLTYSVVPAAPFIETPATDEHIGRRTVVSGFGVPGDTVAVRLDDAARTVLGGATVLEDRTWSVTLEIDQPGGPRSVLAVSSSEGFDSADSAPRNVVLGTYAPSFEAPAAGRWVANPVVFEGRGRPGTGNVVSWFNPEQVWAPGLEVGADGWQGGATQSLPVGANWCRFQQTLIDSGNGETVSDWVQGPRFETLPPAQP